MPKSEHELRLDAMHIAQRLHEVNDLDDLLCAAQAVFDWLNTGKLFPDA